MKGSVTNTPRRFMWLCCCAVLAGILVTVAAGPVVAQEEETQSLGDLETQETASMREATYKELAKAQEAAEAERYSEAIQVLDKLAKSELNNYERSQLLNLYAYIYYAQDDIPKAIRTYEQLLEQPELPEALKTSTVFTLSQLHFSQENWQRAIDMLEWWLTLTKDDNLMAHEMMAQAYYQMGKHREALQPARKVVELTKAEGQPVKENSYLLLRVLYYEIGDYNQAATMLKELIRQYPKKQYWIQLASLYGQMEDQRKQLNVLELAYLQGYLVQEAEVLTLASLLLNEELPLRAARVLRKGLDSGVITSTLEHWRLLAQAWTMAQEYEQAIPALTRAAELSQDGKLDVILAQSYMNLDRWSEAVAAARNGIRKGGLDRADQAYVLIGQALFEMEQFDEARQAFGEAQADRRSRQLAAQWLSYIDSEEERLAKLREALE